MITQQQRNEDEEQKMRTDMRSGNLLKICSACKREIELYEETFDFGGTICKECYIDAGEGFKALSK